MKFKRIIILGTGKLAVQCAKEVQDLGIYVEVYDTNQSEAPLLRQALQKQDIVCKRVNKEAITRDLKNINDMTLLISAINPYLVPDRVLGNIHILAINCHFALLPKHPGRNAEAWAIYEQDHKTGITWHLMTSDIDSGDIISQEKLPIKETHTSLELLKELNQLAYQSFCKFLPNLLDNNVTCYPQDVKIKGSVHYSWDVPNGGFLDPDWPAKKISAFLRSMDYGIIELMGKPKLLLNGRCYNWKNYKIEKKLKPINQDCVKKAGTTIIIKKGTYQFSLNRCYQNTQ